MIDVDYAPQERPPDCRTCGFTPALLELKFSKGKAAKTTVALCEGCAVSLYLILDGIDEIEAHGHPWTSPWTAEAATQAYRRAQEVDPWPS